MLQGKRISIHITHSPHTNLSQFSSFDTCSLSCRVRDLSLILCDRTMMEKFGKDDILAYLRERLERNHATSSFHFFLHWSADDRFSWKINPVFGHLSPLPIDRVITRLCVISSIILVKSISLWTFDQILLLLSSISPSILFLFFLILSCFDFSFRISPWFGCVLCFQSSLCLFVETQTE